MSSIITWFSGQLGLIYSLVASNGVLSAFCLIGFVAGIIQIVVFMLGNK